MLVSLLCPQEVFVLVFACRKSLFLFSHPALDLVPDGVVEDIQIWLRGGRPANVSVYGSVTIMGDSIERYFVLGEGNTGDLAPIMPAPRESAAMMMDAAVCLNR